MTTAVEPMLRIRGKKISETGRKIQCEKPKKLVLSHSIDLIEMISREKITTNASNQLLEKRQARRCNWAVIQSNRSAGRCECQSKQLHAPSPQRHPPMQFCLVIAIIFTHNHKTCSFLDWRAICFAFSPLHSFLSLSLSCGQIWSPRCDENHPKKTQEIFV